jgi:hypothetical protein
MQNMARTLRYLFVLFCLFGSRLAFGQATPGEITGTVLDDKKEPVVQAVIEARSGGILKGGAVTDLDGKYSIKPIDAGRYDVTVKALSYKETTETGVLVSPDKTTGLDFSLQQATNTINEHVVIAYKVPLIDKYAPGGSTTITSEQIEKMPTRDIQDIAATSAGVYQAQRGGDLSLGGGRTEGTLYIIDGVQVQGQAAAAISVAQGSIDQVTVMTSGIPAKYGDASGGVISITTKGVSQQYTGDVQLQHSIDGYNNNFANFSLSGPIIRKKMADGTTKPIMGFSLTAEVYDDHDRYPFFDEQFVAKPSVLSQLQQNPLHPATDANGNQVFYYSSDYVTTNDLTTNRYQPGNLIQEGRANGKLDFQLSDNLSLTAGGSFDYQKQDLWQRSWSLFSSDVMPVLNSYTSRAYIRFTQRFGKEDASSSTSTDKTSIISNAYYTIQGDFQNESSIEEDPTFKSNIFDYAYIGKFNETTAPIYSPLTKDSVSGYTGTVYEGQQVTQVTFNRSNMNPVLANYTSQYLSLVNTPPTSLAQIEANNALLNGDEPASTYGLFANVGQSMYLYAKTNFNQYSLSADASFDLQTGKTKHSIEFGLYYQQRIESSYTVNANLGTTQSLWQLMRQSVNTQITLDKSNPIFVINGQHYTLSQVQNGAATPGPTDTILYNYTANTAAQTVFDKNLRKKLGMDTNGTNMINIDALSPSTFSLGMFSADELLNGGNPYVNYQGYTYTGAAQSGNVSFNDFFTAKDANGNYTRPIAAFSPNYIAGYIMDKFQFKDILFNVGLRIERYDANTNVMIDPFSLYPEYHVGQVPGSDNTLNGGEHPANMGSNYVVYVNDPTATTPTIAGYRNGASWFDPYGNAVSDPSLLNQYTGGKDPIPYLIKNYKVITDPDFNPNLSFTNYTPQVNLLPRISFSFPISDVALFYAHYDIYAQRPTTGIDGTAYQYYYMTQNSNQIIANPDLKPQTTIDYEVGFQQKLSDQSAVTISGFYKERKDMITIVPYIDAYPTTYYTYGNRDFSTTKGMTLKYDLRRINHIRLSLAYTLQFAEGTGSTPLSGNGGSSSQVSPNGLLQNFIEAGLPNLRYISVLNTDSRHNLTANVDYRYNQDEGPIIGGLHVLQNAGLNLIFKARSGEPYTRYIDPDNVSQVVIGGVNGSRLPWHYDVDLRVDKDFALRSAKRLKDVTEGVKPKKPLYLNVFIYVQNLLNTRDILSVYGYTSRPGNDGYVTSSFGQQYVPQQINPASYADLFNYSYDSPYNLNWARTISLGVEFNF